MKHKRLTPNQIKTIAATWYHDAKFRSDLQADIGSFVEGFTNAQNLFTEKEPEYKTPVNAKGQTIIDYWGW